MSLLYRPDWDEARRRAAVWWNGGDIGRPMMQLYVPRREPYEEIPVMPEPAGWITRYSTKSLPYRINLALRECLMTQYFAEAVPVTAPGDLAPNCLALYLGCHGVELPGTVWCEPAFNSPENAKFEFNPDDFYWKFSVAAHAEAAEKGKGKFLQQFPDLIEGLDTLAAMRGTEELLQDLIDRPDWVRESLDKITDLYFRYYDRLYDIIRDEVGGSVFWAWAPGRLSKFQCDFSAMISPAMFGEFMMPVLREMTARVSYSMYHWDGPGAIKHHDHLLSLPDLDMLQWTPGAGSEPVWHQRWWPLYHKTFEAGKKCFIIEIKCLENLIALRKEFGESCKGFLISAAVETPEMAETFIKAMEF